MARSGYVGLSLSMTLFTDGNKSFNVNDNGAILVGHAARESYPD